MFRLPFLTIRPILVLFAMIFVAGCTQTANSIENAANRSSTSWAMGKPYTQVAALGTSTLAQLSTEPIGYGPMIRQSPLANGDILYRHVAPAAERSQGSDFGGIVASQRVNTNVRLSYFRVGADGVVSDWATGSAPGSVSDCIQYLGGLIKKCEDAARIRLGLQAYDARVKTRSGEPLSAWNVQY